jgi:replicative DNA helicase
MTEKLIPFSDEAEKCLLCSMMLDPKAIDGCRTEGLNEGHFFVDDHKTIYREIVALRGSNRPVDAVLLREQMKRTGTFEEVGGLPYLAEILNSAPSSAHWKEYAKIIVEKADRRNLIELANGILRGAYGDDETDALRRKAISTLAAGERAGEGIVVRTAREIAEGVYLNLDSGVSNRLPSCLPALQRVLGGYGSGEDNIIAAIPSCGKSVLASQELDGWASAGIPVGLVSLEETDQLIGEKMLSRKSGVANWRIRQGKSHLLSTDYASLANATGLVSEKMHVTHPRADLDSVVATINHLKAKYGIKAVAIDHIHCMRVKGMKSRYEELTLISSTLKGLFLELNIVGIKVCQLNRNMWGRDKGHQRPTRSDLRDAGSLDQDADSVLLVHRDDAMHIGDPNWTKKHDAVVIVAKNRGGNVGDTGEKLTWNGDNQRIEEGPRPASDIFGVNDPFVNGN